LFLVGETISGRGSSSHRFQARGDLGRAFGKTVLAAVCEVPAKKATVPQ